MFYTHVQPKPLRSTTVERPWYEHVKELYCICGLRLIGRRRRTAKELLTSYTCEEITCHREVIFRDGQPE